MDEKPEKKRKPGSITMKITVKERESDTEPLHQAELKLTATLQGRIAVTLTGETESLHTVGRMLQVFEDQLSRSSLTLTFTPPPTEEQPEKKDEGGERNPG